MRTKLRSKITLLFMTFAVLLAVPAIALASDILSVDGDALTSNADTAIDLGTVDPGQAIKASDGNDYQASFQLACAVQGSNNTHVDRGKIVKLSYSAADSQLNGATVSATDATITPTPTNTSWPTDGNSCPATAPVLNDTGNSTLTMTAPKASGKKDVSVAYSYTVRNADGTLYANEDDKAIQGGYPGTKTIKYTLTVRNLAPTIDLFQVSSTDDGTSAKLGDTKTYQIGASDPNEDNLTYSLTALAGSASTTITNATTANPSVKFNATGTVTLRETVKDGVNTVTRDKTVTVSPAQQSQTITFDANTPSTKTFGDANFNVSATASSGLPVSFAAKAGSNCTVSSAGLVNLTGAGSCTVVASQSGNASYLAAPNVERTITINKATPTIAWSNPADITYGTTLSAAQLNATAKGVDGNSLAGSFAYTPASGTKLDAGDNQDLKADFTPSDASNYNSASKTVQINVKKANQTITFGALADKTYGDANFALSASSDSGLDVSFDSTTPAKCSVSNGSVSILEAGTCTIEASQGGNSNYNAATSVSRSFEIAKKTASMSLSGLSKVFNGSPQGATVSTTPAGLSGVSVTYDGNAQAPTNAGSYAVVAKLNNPNYEATDATGTLVIEKAQAQVSLSGLSHTYDGTVKAASASTTPSGLNVELAYSQNGNAATPKNAGSYAVEATVNEANYKGQATGTLVIKKAHADINLSDLSKVYNGSPQGATVSTTPDVPNAQLTVTYDGSQTKPTNAGSYAVVASLNDANYEATDATGTLVIAKAHATLSPSGLNQVYNGSPRTVTVSTTPAGLSGVSVTYDGNAQAPTNAGSYAVVAKLNNPNYEAQDFSGTLVVEKAVAQVNLSGLSKVYNGSPQGATVVTTPANLNVDVTYDGNEQAPTNAGSYAVEATVNEANYKGQATGTLVIANATPQISINWSNSTYNGNANGASATVSGVGTPSANLGAADSLAYYAGLTASGTALPDAPTNAGTYTVKAIFNGAANYNATSATKTITIAQATPVITWSTPSAIDYGTALSSAQLNASADVAGSFSYTPAAGTVLKAGTKTLTADFTPADSGNYSSANAQVQIVVNPYSFTGFFQPIDMGIFNSAKAGSTIPVKFSLGGDKGMNILAQNPTAQKIACDPSQSVDAIEEVTSATSGLKYDPLANQYIYNWKTASSYAGTCQQLIVRLADGTTVKSANFKFTR